MIYSQKDGFYSIFLANIVSVLKNLAPHKLTLLYNFLLASLYKQIPNKSYLFNECSIQYFISLFVVKIPFIMNDLYISSVSINYFK